MLPAVFRPPMNWIAIALGGALGALARYGLSSWIARVSSWTVLSGTLVANVLGCFALGLVLGLVIERDAFSAFVRELLTVGLLGSFTTFSTFGWETLELFRDGQWRLAGLYVGLNVVVGLAAVAAGRTLARALA